MNTSKNSPSDKSSEEGGLKSKYVLIIFLCIIGCAIYLIQPTEIMPILITQWEKQVNQVGVGSPRVSDINQDGIINVLDIVLLVNIVVNGQ